MPKNGTSIGADPIGMLRGAPSPELAHRFIEFVLSPEGQKLWNFKVGAPGGPDRNALRRPPIRRDFYVPENLPWMTDPEVNPYDAALDFTYNPEWTGPLFSAIRFIVRTTSIDSHQEQKAAWKALIDSGLPADGVAQFENIDGIDYHSVVNELAPALSARDKVADVKMGRELAAKFRLRYLAIARNPFAE